MELVVKNQRGGLMSIQSVNTHKKKSISQYILENILTNNKNKDLNSEVLTKLIDVNTLKKFIYEKNNISSSKTS